MKKMKTECFRLTKEEKKQARAMRDARKGKRQQWQEKADD